VLEKVIRQDCGKNQRKTKFAQTKFAQRGTT